MRSSPGAGLRSILSAAALLLELCATAKAQPTAMESSPETEQESCRLAEGHLGMEMLGGLFAAVPAALVGTYAGCGIANATAGDDPRFDGCDLGAWRGFLVGAGLGFGAGVILAGYQAGAEEGWWQTLLATVAATAAVVGLTHTPLPHDVTTVLGGMVLLFAPLTTFELVVH